MDAPEESLICRCYVVTEYVIREAIRKRKLQTIEAVTACTNAGGGCSSCHQDIQDILDSIWGTKHAVAAKAPAALTNAQKRTLVLKAIEQEIKPLLHLNALEVHLVGVEGNRVLARLRGQSVGTQQPSFLAIKWFFVTTISEYCGQRMNLVEVNVLESHARNTPAIRR